MTKRISLTAGDYRLELLPEAGGAIGALAWRHPERGWIDLMRPTPAGSIRPKPVETACFPLVPFANRIRDGRFTFRGRTVQFPASPSGKHYLHGTAWLHPWSEDERVNSATEFTWLNYRHEPDAWPYAFETSQHFWFDSNGLNIELSTTNKSAEPMPFGFGLHPYFPRTPLCRLEADVSGWWECDDEVMPAKLTGVRPDIDPRTGLAIASVVCDNAFTGWKGPAKITWPERRTSLTMTTTPQMGVLFLYVPPGLDHFCVEPNSHFADAVNLVSAGRTDTGLIVLEPGQSAGAVITFKAAVA